MKQKKPRKTAEKTEQRTKFINRLRTPKSLRFYLETTNEKLLFFSLFLFEYVMQLSYIVVFISFLYNYRSFQFPIYVMSECLNVCMAELRLFYTVARRRRRRRC